MVYSLSIKECPNHTHYYKECAGLNGNDDIDIADHNIEEYHSGKYKHFEERAARNMRTESLFLDFGTTDSTAQTVTMILRTKTELIKFQMSINVWMKMERFQIRN